MHACILHILSARPTGDARVNFCQAESSSLLGGDGGGGVKILVTTGGGGGYRKDS